MLDKTSALPDKSDEQAKRTETPAEIPDMSPLNTNFHSGFLGCLKLLLWNYREKVIIESEKWLSTQGIRMDVLILKKDPSVDIDSDIARIFKGHNILEYKRKDDDLTVDVVAKVLAYANLYKSQGVPTDSIPYTDISATIYRHTYPREAFRKLKSLGAEVSCAYSGVYYITGVGLFPFQVLVGKQLNPIEYAMFRVLVPGASDDDIRNFKKMIVRNNDEAYQKSVDDILQVSITSNKETYNRLRKEDPDMCEALKDLMREEMREELIKMELKGEARGEAKEAVRIYHDEMHLTPAEIADKIRGRFNLGEKEADEFIAMTLGLRPI